MSNLDMSIDLQKNPWTLADKIQYGGLGYGSFCLPRNFFVIVITILFPPLGLFINLSGDTITSTFPFVTWELFYNILQQQTITKLVYSFLLTCLFYIPGLVYVLTHIVDSELITPKPT